MRAVSVKDTVRVPGTIIDCATFLVGFLCISSRCVDLNVLS